MSLNWVMVTFMEGSGVQWLSIKALESALNPRLTKSSGSVSHLYVESIPIWYLSLKMVEMGNEKKYLRYLI